MKNLIWKQWYESRIYFASFLVWMVAAALYCIAYETGHRYHASVGQFSGWASGYSLVAAILLGMRTSQGERSVGTLLFSASLPVSNKRMATIRIVAAMLTLAVPILVGASILAFALMTGVIEQATPRAFLDVARLPERPLATRPVALEQLASVAMIATFGGIELLLILSVIGCRLRSESQVGYLGAILAFGTLIAGGTFWYGDRNAFMQLAFGVVLPQSLVIQWGFGTIDGGYYTDHQLALHRWIALVLAVPLLTLLVHQFVLRYGHVRRTATVKKSRRVSYALPSLWPRGILRLPNRGTALIWLELRQALPLALSGLAFALLIALATVLIEPQQQSTLAAVQAEMPHMVAFVGMLWAAVVGTGIYSADLDPKLGAFWRSRPIAPSTWFWCKYIIGLIVVLSVLDGVTILVTWSAPRTTMTTGMSWAYIGCFPVIHALMYTLAVLGTCYVRKPAIGAFLAILVFTIGTTIVTTSSMTSQLEPTNIYNQLLSTERAGTIDFSQHSYPLVYGTIASSIIALAFVACRCARPMEATKAGRWQRNRLATV